MKRVVCLAVLLLQGTLALPSQVLANPSLCNFGVMDALPHQCFAAKDVFFAEKRMPTGAVRPTHVVWERTHLRLNQVELRIMRSPFEIQYLFGRIPIDANGLPALGATLPHYAIVSEQISHGGWKERLARDGTGDGRSYWVYFSTMRCGHLNLSIWSNEPRGVVGKIGRRLSGLDACRRMLTLRD